MKIIKFKKDKGNTYKVYFDDGNIISLYDDVIVKYNLLCDKIMDNSKFNEITNYNDFLDGYYKSIKYINKKLRTELEIEKYLTKLEIEKSDIDKIIKLLYKDGYLNREIYYKAYINDKYNLSNDGPYKIKKDLEKLGYNDEEFVDYLCSLDWKNKLNNIIDKRIKINHKLSNNMLKNKLVNDLLKLGYDKNSILAGEGPLMKDLVNTSDTDFNNVNYSSMICILLIMFIVLKSLSLPFLLILTIEFAIITNMSVSYFSGTVLPFVAPIVLGTIQLGATIDYAILMTTNYIKRRKDGMDKNKAMKETLSFCCNSIIVSGMCFFAATFGVGVYSKLEMVASLCTLISRGALISMFTVIVILPCVLLTFDKIVMKTTKI